MRPFPAVVAEIQAMAASPNASLAEIAKVVETDVAFSARVLTLVNSAAMGLVRPCATIRHATTLLGTRGIANLATAVAALAIVDDVSATNSRVAKHARIAAGIARILAPLCGVPADEAFTAALLHDIGLLMLLQSRDGLYEELVDQLGPMAEPSRADERALLGFDHAELGAHVLRRWRLPDPIAETVGMHHDVDAALALGGHVATLTAIVGLADDLALRVAARPQPTDGDAEALANDRAVVFLKLSPEDLLARWNAFHRAGDGWGDRSAAADTPRPSPVPSPETQPIVDGHAEPKSNRTAMIASAIVAVLAASGILAFVTMR